MSTQYPEHPAVDWSTCRKGENGRLIVNVKCPRCEKWRTCDVHDTVRRIREGSFHGYCYKDRLLQKKRADSRPDPEHPQVEWSVTKALPVSGQRLTHVRVTCPICGDQRWHQRSAVREHVYRGTFTGKCIECSGKARKREWKRLSPYRKVDPVKGYVRIGRKAVPEEDRWLWDGLVAQIRGTSVLEHRFVMSKVLGRPVTPEELVDHMDGDKQNNNPDNLRVYIRGRNMPGDTNGYGVYYHEWQTALAEVRRLQQEIEKLREEISK